MKFTFQSFLTLLITCSFLTLFSFYLHVSSFTNTMINYVDENNQQEKNFCVSDEFLAWAVDYHKMLPDFKKRQVTTFLVEQIHQIFNVRVSVSFTVLNFLVFFFCGFLIYYLAKLYLLSHIQAIVSVVFFYSSFSILLAFFIPIATYDEPIQYFFIVLSFIALKKKARIFFIVFFTMAIITRESSLLLLPAIGLFLMDLDLKKLFREKTKLLIAFSMCLLPVIFYSIFLVCFYQSNPELIVETKTILSDKTSIYKKNFRDVKNTSRTILSFVSVFLVPLFLMFFFYKKNENQLELKYAFWITFVINSTIVFLSVYAEESRVFTLPLLFVFPIMGKIILCKMESPFLLLKYLIHPFRLLMIFIVTISGWFAFDFLYNLTELNMNENLYREYNTMSLFFIMILSFTFKYHHKMRLGINLE